MAKTLVVCGACARKFKVEERLIGRLASIKCPSCQDVGSLSVELQPSDDLLEPMPPRATGVQSAAKSASPPTKPARAKSKAPLPAAASPSTDVAQSGGTPWLTISLISVGSLIVLCGILTWWFLQDPFAAWKPAHIVLMTPNKMAIGLSRQGGDEYRVVTTLRGNDVERLTQALTAQGSVLLIKDEAVVQQLEHQAHPGQLLKSTEAEAVYLAIESSKPFNPSNWKGVDLLVVDDESGVGVGLARQQAGYGISAVAPRAPQLTAAEDLLKSRSIEVVRARPALVQQLLTSVRQNKSLGLALVAEVAAIDPAAPKQPKPGDRPNSPADIERWNDADIVLVDFGRSAVGLQRREGESLVVVAKTDGSRIDEVLKFLHGRPVDVIATDAKLATDVYRTAVEREPLHAALVDRVHAKFRDNWQFADQSNAEEPRLVIFRQYNVPEPQVGYFHAANPTALLFRPTGPHGPTITVPRTSIIPGTLQVARGRQILRAMTNVSFLKYCLLMVAKHLDSKPGDAPERRQVAFFAELNLPKPVEPNAPQLQDRRRGPGLGGVMMFDLDIAGAIEAAVKYQIFAGKQEKFLKDSAVYKHYEDFQNALEDQLALQLAGFGVDTCDRTYVRQRVAEYTQASGKQLTAEELLRAVHATHLLRMTVGKAQQVGDYHVSVELLRLHGGKTSVLWRDSTDDTLRDEPTPDRRFHLDSGQVARLMLPKVKPGTQPSRPASTGKSASPGDAPTKKQSASDDDQEPADGEQDSADGPLRDQRGEKKSTATGDFQGYEDELVLTPLNVRSRLDHVVYLERLPGKGWCYRSLFSSTLVPINADLVPYDPRRKPSSDPEAEQRYQAAWRFQEVKSLSEVPAEFQNRYLLCECLRQCLPQAGRVIGVARKQRRAWASFRADAGLKTGDTLIAVRQSTAGDIPLSAILRVVDRSEHMRSLGADVDVSNVVELEVEANGMEEVWEDLVDIAVNDLVQRPTRATPVIGIMTPLYLPPEPKSDVVNECMAMIRKETRKNRRGKQFINEREEMSHAEVLVDKLRQDLRSQSQISGQTLTNSFTDAFRRLGVRTQQLPWSEQFFHMKEVDQDREAALKFKELARLGANYVVGSYIRPVGATIRFDNGVNSLNVHTFDWSLGVRTADLNPDDKDFIKQSELKANWKVRVQPRHLEKQ